MDNKASGEVYIDVYLLLDKVEIRDCDKSILDKCIGLDMLISEFDVDSYSIPDMYAHATQRIRDYTDELIKQLSVIFNGVFENCDLNTLTGASNHNIIVASSGRVWVKRQVIAHVTGENPKLQLDDLNRKIEKDIYDYLGDDIAGISPEFTFAVVVPAIK